MVIIINNPYSTRFCPSIDGSLVGNPNSGMKFYQSLKNAWLMLLNDYSSLDSQTENYLSDILKITFSFSTTIIIFNILSTWLIKSISSFL